MNLQQDKENLLDLIKLAYQGKLVLPDFQRNFVWERLDIEELIKSLLEEVFIGTFLILNTNKDSVPFKTILIQGVQEINPNVQLNPSRLILDGQQRLTALFYAIYSPDIPLRNTETPYRFFIDLNKLVEENIEEAVFSWSINWREYKSFLNENNELMIEKLVEKRILPLIVLKEKDNYFEIRYKVLPNLFNEKQIKIIDKYLKNLLDCQVITLNLSSSYSEKPDEIIILFERINKTGIRLSTYDLLNARFYKFIKLREEWEKVFNSKPNIRKYASRVDNTNVPYSFIQSLALANHQSIKSKDLIKIDENILNKNNWIKVVNLVEDKVLATLNQINRFGIGDIEKWLPYNPLVTLLTAFYLINKHLDSEKINTWYWSAVFTERYSGSTESYMMKDFREVTYWMNNTKYLPEVVEQFLKQLSNNVFTLFDVKKRGSSKYKGVFNLIFMNNAQDFFEPENLAFNLLEDHHIFPKDFLKSKNVEVDYDIVLNRTLIFSETNKRISNKSPADYVNEMINNFISKGLNEYEAKEKVKSIFKGHFVDDEMFEILLKTNNDLSSDQIKENFERFIKKREELIVNRIKELVNFSKLIDYVNVGPKISDRSKLYKQFWESLLIKSNSKFDFFSTRNFTIYAYLSKRLYKGIELVYFITTKKGKVGLYIDFGEGMKKLNTKVFDILFENKEEFEKISEYNISWRRPDNKNRSASIYILIEEGNIYQVEKWDKLQDIMVDKMYELYKLMQKYMPLIKKITKEFYENK